MGPRFRGDDNAGVFDYARKTNGAA